MNLRPLAASLPAAAWGAAAGLWTPRGPGSTTEALVAIGVSLAAGLLAGWLGRSRWAVLLAPVLFWIALELVRLPVQGPTVDAPRLSAFGAAALLLGRGVHALLTVLPLAVGAAYGAGLARRGTVAAPRRLDRTRRWAGRAGAGLAAAALLGVAVVVGVPARTAAVPGGVAELTTVEVNGRAYGLLLRGADPAAPVLLSVPGPGGGSDMGAAARHLGAVERRFVVATLDRRGGPKSWGAWAPTSAYDAETEVADLLAIAEHLRARFGGQRIVLAAHSGGSILGALAVQRRPELFRAYVGIAQAVDLPEADAGQYADSLAWARERGDRALERALVAGGPPPYTGGIAAGEALIASEPRVYAFDRAPGGERDATEPVGAPEYAPLDKAHYLAAILDGWDVLYPRMQDIDLRERVPRLAVPVWFVDGAHDVPARLRLLAQWHAGLQAPRKEHVVLPGAGHRPQYEQPAAFAAVLDDVLAGS